jgi:hypothetical protein
MFMDKIADSVLQLIHKFMERADHYRSGDYKEAQCGVDVVRPTDEELRILEDVANA